MNEATNTLKSGYKDKDETAMTATAASEECIRERQSVRCSYFLFAPGGRSGCS